MSLHLQLLDIDHPLTFEESKLRQIEAHALIYLSGTHRGSTIDILTLKLNVRGFDSCKISKSLGLASLKKIFYKKGQGD